MLFYDNVSGLSQLRNSLPRLARSGTYDEFLNEDGLANTSSSKETNLATTSVGSKKIDNLNASFQDLCGGGLFNEFGGICVNGSLLGVLDRPPLINWITSDVHDTAKRAGSNRNHDRRASICHFSATDDTPGT